MNKSKGWATYGFVTSQLGNDRLNQRGLTTSHLTAHGDYGMGKRIDELLCNTIDLSKVYSMHVQK